MAGNVIRVSDITLSKKDLTKNEQEGTMCVYGHIVLYIRRQNVK